MAEAAAAETGYPLSAQQLQLLSNADGDAESYRTSCTVSLRGRLDLDILRSALLRAVFRHEVLRTTYRAAPGMKAPLSVVVEEPGESAFALEARDLSRLAPAARRAELEALFAWQAQKPQELDRLPMLDALLTTLGPSRHLLRLQLPALSADAASLRNLAAELSILYACRDATLGEPLQYADYTGWQEEQLRLEDEAAREALAFWRARDAAPARAIRLPLEKSAADEAPGMRDVVSRVISGTSLETVDGAAERLGVCLAAFLYAAWQALVFRLTGDEDVPVGLLCDGRRDDDLKSAIGLFTRWVPAGVSVNESESFRELAEQANATLRDCTDLQDHYPTRRRRGLPFGSLGFAFHEAPRGPSGPVAFSVMTAESRLASFTVELSATRGSALHLAFRYDVRVLDRAAVDQMARAYVALLLAAAARPDEGVEALPLLDDRGRREALLEHNRTDRPRPEATAHALFEKSAAARPDDEAVVCGDERIAYGELNARANRLAHLLRRRGVGPDVVVGLCLRPGIALVGALLGILKAGGAYLPLSPDNPPERLRAQLVGSGAALVVTDSRHDGLIAESGLPSLRLDDAEGLLARESAENPAPLATREHLVYVITTSGSTGLPKPVAVTHANLVNYAHHVTRIVAELAPGARRFATVSSPAADLGNTAIYGALFSGGTLHVVPHEVATDPSLFAETMKTEGIEVLKIVPSHLRALLGSPPSVEVLPSRLLVLGGEALPRELAELVLALAPRLRVLNHYGPTETTVGSLVYPLPVSLPETASRTVPIGRPIANTRAYVLDGRGEPVPPGVAGELFIAGDGVARGYLKQPGPTAERFLDDPFASAPGARMYRTGDLVRRLADGDVEFLGRRDEQVKVRGYRVELAEIERAIVQHPSIRQAVVVARDERLAAYVVPGAEGRPSKEELRRFLAAKLPEYMLPGDFIPVSSLPLLPSGKVDRRALPMPEALAEEEFVAPRDEAESALAAIWAEVFSVPRLSVTADFFELGGHSLIATQILSRVKRALGVALVPSTLFENPTIAGMACALARLRGRRDSAGEELSTRPRAAAGAHA